MRASYLAPLLLLSACASTPPQRYEGVWEWGFEHNRFFRPGHDEEDEWCLHVSASQFRALRATAPADMSRDSAMRLHVVLEGRAIDAPPLPPPDDEDGFVLPNGFGHRGLCRTQIDVTHVIESRFVGWLDYETGLRPAALPLAPTQR